VTDELLATVTEAVPDAWLDGADRDIYPRYLRARLYGPRAFVEEAERARGG
jgi:hypothetical protein